MKQKQYLIALGLLVILGGGYWLFTKNKTATAPQEQNNEQTNQNGTANNNTQQEGTATNQLNTSKSAVAVSTQIPGNYVTVDNFYLEKPGFIIIHEAKADGSAGTVVGQSGLLSGTGQDLELKATVKAGQKYIALIHTDNGDKKFNATTDEMAMGANNKAITVSFQVSN